MQFRKNLALALAVAGALTSAAPAIAGTNTLTVTMKALNGSNENGTAVLTQTGSSVRVVVKLDNAPATAQPTHIHIGTCGNINKAPEYALVSVMNGKSTSIVPGITIDQLLKSHYAINVHKSASDLATYVSCGDIKAQ
jgi:Cu/Zn superoxide dismutase